MKNEEMKAIEILEKYNQHHILFRTYRSNIFLQTREAPELLCCLLSGAVRQHSVLQLSPACPFFPAALLLCEPCSAAHHR